MYENHFSFKNKPFELVPNPDYLFLSSTHKKAITYLDYGIKEKVGFILLTGEVGSGKTTIVRNLLKNLDSSVKLSRVNNTKITSEQLISMINEDFGLDVESKNKTKLLSELNGFLVEQYSKEMQSILLIDEAQNLSADLLEEIRMLSNLETDRAKLLQIILIGQPELKKSLMLPELRQLRQRININYHITPLSIDETSKYIKHRITVAGNPDAIQLGNDTLSLIYQFTRGIPRLINILCDFALLSAYVEGEDEVTAATVSGVAKDLEAHAYWNELQDDQENENGKKAKDPLSFKDGEDILLKFSKFEKLLNENIQKITALMETINRLENGADEVAGIKNNRFTDLLDRVSQLEDNSVLMNDLDPSSEISTEEQQPDQVDSLKKMISSVNKKLNKL